MKILFESMSDILNLVSTLNYNKEEKCELFPPLHDMENVKKEVLQYDYVFSFDTDMYC